jgi:hypothetical protein
MKDMGVMEEWQNVFLRGSWGQVTLVICKAKPGHGMLLALG